MATAKNSSTSPSERQQTDNHVVNRIAYIDWLRCLAVLFVVVGHGRNDWMPGGAIGVSIFFVLSGYLIASILLRDGMFRPINLLKFIVRRILRIYPMLAVQVAVVIAFYAILKPAQLSTAVAAAPGLLTFSEDPEWLGYGFGVLWSLTVEFWFYVTFPIIFLMAVKIRFPVPMIFIGISVSVANKVHPFGGQTLMYYDHFLLGALCAVLIANKKIPNIFSWKYFLPVSFVAILIMGQVPYPGARNLLWYSQSLAAASTTACAILAGYVKPPTLRLEWAAYLGRISYSMYLMHAIVLDLFVYFVGSARPFLLFLGVSILLSSITYLTIEKPMERLAHRYINYRKHQNDQSARKQDSHESSTAKMNCH